VRRGGKEAREGGGRRRGREEGGGEEGGGEEAQRTARRGAREGLEDLGLQDGPEPLDLLLVVGGAVHRAAVRGGVAAVLGRGNDVRDGDGDEVPLAPGVEHALGRAEVQRRQGSGEDGERQGLAPLLVREVGRAGAGLHVRRAVDDAPEEVKNQPLVLRRKHLLLVGEGDADRFFPVQGGGIGWELLAVRRCHAARVRSFGKICGTQGSFSASC
jgi:hypothetical protein